MPSPPDGLVEDGQLVKRRRADGAVAVPKRNISAYHLFAKHVTKQVRMACRAACDCRVAGCVA